MTQIVLSKDGTKIAFDQEGEAETVNLVGGTFQHSPIDRRAKQFAPLLSKHFTVIHCDRRGRGERVLPNHIHLTEKLRFVGSRMLRSGVVGLFHRQ